ncbi:molybdate ABC transporter substrate-binding protein [Simiduia sp. 21SJ11W-1]|uniref:molybdate ABC transporter substrate-binding protein n=1 Tax=Simiduia sp. 21SJ11W-1 TaxID=2909669 RepID=UPI0020A04334|nr:molybdate ABC transporter substrate-binding protein [Simiduia sp. 21SJ11W-1]UTA48492.1 molybdate ABC transporter substrate-binding protein [Simiduia sp. 21SJ11W-1]
MQSLTHIMQFTAQLGRYLILALWCINGAQAAEPLRVAVASNFSPSLHTLLAQFHQQHPKINVQVSAGASGQLFAQIVQGAPFDVYLAANTDYPQKLFARQLAQMPVTYAHGRLLLISRHSGESWQALLAQTERLAMANPALAPYGAAAQTLLQQAPEFNGRVLTATAVSQVQHWFAASHVDSAFAAASLQPANADYTQLDVTPFLAEPIAQQLAVLTRTRQPQAAADFVQFLLSANTQALLQAQGFRALPEIEKHSGDKPNPEPPLSGATDAKR